MDKKTINDVRNVLMNELGLTRESIRSEVEKIVISTVDGHIKTLFEDDRLDSLVKEIVVAELNRSPYSNELPTIRSAIIGMAKEAAKRFVDENVTIKSVDKP